MIVRPITVRDASRFVDQHHRHHGASRGAAYCLGADFDGQLVGVVMCGRPIARRLHDGWTIEITRCATDGTRNACSFLYRAAVRVACAMGYRRIVTYTLTSELGASLRGAGFREDGIVPGKTWSRANRLRSTPMRGDKRRWTLEIDNAA